MNNIIKSLNLTEGSVLTLEKLPDRIEFEAIAVMAGYGVTEKTICGIKIDCTVCTDCPSLCEVCPYKLPPCPDYHAHCPSKGMP